MKRWTAEETKLLKEKYPILNNDEIVSVFVNRKFSEIYTKAHRLGLKRTKETARGIYQSKHKWEHKKYKTRSGYILIYDPNHPRRNRSNRVLEHIAVWEKFHNMPVPDGFIIHHINGIRDDNRPENLQLMSDAEHKKHHNKNRTTSVETRQKISQSKIGKMTGEKNHKFKNVDVLEMERLILNGEKVKDVCERFGIHRNNYYKKLKQAKEN